MSIADKLQYTLNAKNAIKDALVTKGVLTGTEPFNEYAGAIGFLSSGSDDMSPFIDTDGVLTGDLTLPSKVTLVGIYAFYYTNITGISFPNNITSIGTSAFEGAKKLVNLYNLPNTINVLGNKSFYGCNNLVTAINLTNLNLVGQYAFRNCSSILSITLLGTYTSLNATFEGCTRLASLTIASSVTKLTYGVFQNCSSLTVINGLENCALVEIGASTSSCSAFKGCTMLETLTLNGTYTTLYADTFSGCTSLESLTIGSTALKTLSGSVFKGLSSLHSIDLSNTIVTSIYSSCFEDCTSLTEISLPSTVTTISSYAFRRSTIATLICHKTTPPTLNATAFDSVSTLTAIYVPDTSVDAYKAATNWVAYVDKILPLSQLT